MSSQFAATLGDAAADLLPRDAVFRVFGLQFLQTIALVAPVGLLLGILLALARLNRDSEMAALAACGIGPVGLLKPIGFLSLLVAAAVGWLSLREAPAASWKIEEISFQAQDQMELEAIEPGSFTTIDTAGSVLYARSAKDDVLLGVFIQRELGDRVELVVAEQAETVIDRDTGERVLELRDGHQYEGIPGKGQWSVAQFGLYGVPRPPPKKRVFEPAVTSLSTATLLQSSDPAARAELEWRIAVPVSILILALLAVPLGKASPREGKYARVGLGLLLYIIYTNALSIAQIWIERGTVPDWLGLWWAHLAMALLGVLLLAQQSRSGTRQVTA